MHTDFPDPVVPAMSKRGMATIPTIGLPEIFLPKAIGSLISFFLKSWLLRIRLDKHFLLNYL